MPVGRERICFNAHRVHSPEKIIRYFEGLELVEFSCVVGEGPFCENVNPRQVDGLNNGCGLFWFRKPYGMPAEKNVPTKEVVLQR